MTRRVEKEAIKDVGLKNSAPEPFPLLLLFRLELKEEGQGLHVEALSQMPPRSF